ARARRHHRVGKWSRRNSEDSGAGLASERSRADLPVNSHPREGQRSSSRSRRSGRFHLQGVSWRSPKSLRDAWGSRSSRLTAGLKDFSVPIPLDDRRPDPRRSRKEPSMEGSTAIGRSSVANGRPSPSSRIHREFATWQSLLSGKQDHDAKKDE